MSLNEIVKTMQDAVNRQTDQAKPGGYDTTATVRRIEGDTAFVHIPGGVDETPVKLTINAKAGDNVQVRVSGGNAFLVGNGSAPPTDDARANQAYTVATVAEGAAENALANASRAKEAADSAQASATRAEGAANDAVIAAGDAQTAAGSAQTAADTALVNLATTEDVVGVLNWITAHGTMTTQSGGVFVPGQVYFISDPAGDYVVGGNHYSVVPEPKADDIDSYYVLTVDESVQNYVATHIVVDSEGLWIIPDAGGNKVLIATGSGSTYTTAGTYIVGKVGGIDTVLASFTASGAQIGQDGTSNMSINAGGQNLYGADGTKTFSVQSAGTQKTVYYSDGVWAAFNDLILSAQPTSGTITAQYYYSAFMPKLTIGTIPCGAPYTLSTTDSMGNSWVIKYDGERSIDIVTHPYSDVYVSFKYSMTIDAPYYDIGVRAGEAGAFSVIAGESLSAETDNQTAIGKYNSNSSGNAFEIGNGTADNARSNALTVDWSGNVEAAGDVTDGSNNTLSSIAAHAVISTGSSNGWNYKKYADGTFEATRFSNSGATGAMTQAGSTGIYYSSAAEITFPSIGITAIRSCTASVMPNSNYLMSYYMSRLTTAHVYFSYIRYGSGSAVTNISYGISITGTYS